jgi:hypothetical protein
MMAVFSGKVVSIRIRPCDNAVTDRWARRRWIQNEETLEEQCGVHHHKVINITQWSMREDHERKREQARKVKEGAKP